MKIKSVKTGQFAGIKNKEINFCDGLNILVGNNESGKSTMIDLLYQTLFKESKLNKKEDKEFITRYMPSDSKGDVIDGTVTFITAEDEYNLSKEWGASEGCKLVTSDGTRIANEEKIRDIIGGELIYKKGLYDDVVIASQKSQANVVEHILKKLDKKADVKQDLVSTIASEGMSTNGEIGPEDIEKVLQVKIEELCGHWDFTTDGPEKRRGIENPFLGRSIISRGTYLYNTSLSTFLPTFSSLRYSIGRVHANSSTSLSNIGTRLSRETAIAVLSTFTRISSGW